MTVISEIRTSYATPFMNICRIPMHSLTSFSFATDSVWFASMFFFALTPKLKNIVNCFFYHEQCGN